MTPRHASAKQKGCAMPDRPMKIGEFAEVVGVSIDAIRFYERRGVLRPAPRTAGGYRTFIERDLDRVRLARQLQQLGLTIDEVVDALTAHEGNGATCTSERWRLEQVEARIDAQMTALSHTRRLIQDALAACDAGRCQLQVTDSPDGRP
jgi:DNA-binding transcriptional MerR regulator